MKGPLSGRVAIVTGASRGIGREVALTFARNGAQAVVIAAKSVKEDPRLPGTIFSVAEEVSRIGSCEGFPIQLDGKKKEKRGFRVFYDETQSPTQIRSPRWWIKSSTSLEGSTFLFATRARFGGR
jgi:NAD(P)-dependent dehydrogenase (short-subunit alcohol dehydrogenase family)